MEIQKFECLENEKSFLDEIENIFHNSWRDIIRWKIFKKKKKKQTQALNIIKINRKTKSRPLLTFNHITKKNVTKVIQKT